MSEIETMPQVGDRTLHPVVRLPNRKGYFPGKGCKCAAHDESECGCAGVDWTSREEHRFRDALEAIKADYEFCKDKPGFGDRASAYYETVCAALQPNTVVQATSSRHCADE